MDVVFDDFENRILDILREDQTPVINIEPPEEAPAPEPVSEPVVETPLPVDKPSSRPGSSKKSRPTSGKKSAKKGSRSPSAKEFVAIFDKRNFIIKIITQNLTFEKKRKYPRIRARKVEKAAQNQTAEKAARNRRKERKKTRKNRNPRRTFRCRVTGHTHGFHF